VVVVGPDLHHAIQVFVIDFHLSYADQFVKDKAKKTASNKSTSEATIDAGASSVELEDDSDQNLQTPMIEKPRTGRQGKVIQPPMPSIHPMIVRRGKP
jgi:hypothetical protein